ncbi:MAG TPA: alpha/beta hydrolase [Polyangiaceae bacterium]|nr:alpha/beta hydrolase [Polyangiaceae bacterium]
MLCYPGVQEYNMAHWAFRRLAGMLSREGFHVLRFDWSGTGDSWGETNDGTIETWLDDVALAAQELRDASAASSISIVGMRLGAALAALACTQGVAAERLVLWEPVVSGSRYIAELEALHARDSLRLLHPVPAHCAELVGFPFSPALRASVGQIDLCAKPPRSAGRVLIVAGAERPDHRALYAALQSLGLIVSYECVPEDPSATNLGQRESALLTTRSLVAIADHLAEKGTS